MFECQPQARWVTEVPAAGARHPHWGTSDMDEAIVAACLVSKSVYDEAWAVEQLHFMQSLMFVERCIIGEMRFTENWFLYMMHLDAQRIPVAKFNKWFEKSDLIVVQMAHSWPNCNGNLYGSSTMHHSSWQHEHRPSIWDGYQMRSELYWWEMGHVP